MKNEIYIIYVTTAEEVCSTFVEAGESKIGGGRRVASKAPNKYFNHKESIPK